MLMLPIQLKGSRARRRRDGIGIEIKVELVAIDICLAFVSALRLVCYAQSTGRKSSLCTRSDAFPTSRLTLLAANTHPNPFWADAAC